jgi:hypothetical protein
MSDKVIYSNALKCKNTLYTLFSELQQNYSLIQYNSTSSTLVQLNHYIQDLQQSIKRQVTQEKKILLQERCNELLKEYIMFTNQLQAIKGKQDQMIQQQREQQRLDLGLQSMHQRKETSVPPFLDIQQKEDRVMDYTSSSVDQYISMGSNALQELYEQRNMIKVLIE